MSAILKLPRARSRRRVLRDLIQCFAGRRGSKAPLLNPTRYLCEDAANVIARLEVALERERSRR